MPGRAPTSIIVALIAGALGLTSVAGAAADVAWVLFVIGLVLMVVGALVGCGRRIQAAGMTGLEVERDESADRRR